MVGDVGAEVGAEVGVEVSAEVAEVPAVGCTKAVGLVGAPSTPDCASPAFA